MDHSADKEDQSTEAVIMLIKGPKPEAGFTHQIILTSPIIMPPEVQNKTGKNWMKMI